MFDLLPKNLDVFVQNMPEQFADLTAAGAHFSADFYSDVVDQHGDRFVEIHMHGHDKTNVVLVETSGSLRNAYSEKGYAGIVQLVNIVLSQNE